MGTFASQRLAPLFNKHIRTAGVLSFSIYLLHAPLLYGACAPVLAAHVGARLHLQRHLPSSLIVLGGELCMWPLVLAASGLLYRFVELPGIALGKKCAQPRGGQSGE